MGTISKTIGSGGTRDFSTEASWISSLPANLVTDGNSYVGLRYPDSGGTGESTVASAITFSGFTTDSTHTITWQCASGQSFRDNSNAQTNRLAYNPSNGVAIKFTGTYTNAVTITSSFVTIDGLQINCTGAPCRAIQISGGTTQNVTVRNCILYAKPAASNYAVDFTQGGSNCIIYNSLVVVNTSNAAHGVHVSSGAKAVNCTVVRPSNLTAGGTAFVSVYGTATARNNAFFNFTTASSGTFNNDGHNCTDLAAAPGTTGNLTSKTYANQFKQNSTASSVEDFRMVGNTADLYDAGVADSTDIPSADDIVGTSRPQGSAWDIGAWELVVAVAANNIGQQVYEVPVLARSYALINRFQGWQAQPISADLAGSTPQPFTDLPVRQAYSYVKSVGWQSSPLSDNPPIVPLAWSALPPQAARSLIQSLTIATSIRENDPMAVPPWADLPQSNRLKLNGKYVYLFSGFQEGVMPDDVIPVIVAFSRNPRPIIRLAGRRR